jgi:histone chaperone ASF1
VGSAHDAGQDQVLDEILVGPVPVGLNKFVLQADPPDPTRLIESNNLLGVTVVLVTCSYREREFVRVGYYVNNEYMDPNAEPAPPAEASPQISSSSEPTATTEAVVTPPPLPPLKDLNLQYVQRQILADKPRVTKFPIPWGSTDEEEDELVLPPQPNEEQSSFIMEEEDEEGEDHHPMGPKFHHATGGMAVDQQLQGTPMTDMDTSMDD